MSGIGGFFSSESLTRQTNTTQNAGFSEIAGGAVSVNLTGGAKGSSVTPQINLTDSGSVAAGIKAAGDGFAAALSAQGAGFDAAMDISSHAVSLGRDALDSGNSIATAGLDHAQAAYSTALNFSGDALARSLDASADTTNRAFSALGEASAGVLDFASGLVSDVLGANQKAVDSNIDAVRGLAMQVSATDSDRVQKVAIYAVVAFAVLGIVPALLKGAK